MEKPVATDIREQSGVKIAGAPTPHSEEILVPEAVEFVVELERRFGARRRELLAARTQRQIRLDAGEWPGFLPQSASLRARDWTVTQPPQALLDRILESTRPV